MKLNWAARWSKTPLAWVPPGREHRGGAPRGGSSVSRYAGRNLFLDRAERDLDMSVGSLPEGSYPSKEALSRLRAELDAAGLTKRFRVIADLAPLDG